ncbi:MAG TPA: hypothetical protein VMY39_07035 [Planctomycetota bacterium]|nr:hypothetical protein [Planctomycetota bacterium]
MNRNRFRRILTVVCIACVAAFSAAAARAQDRTVDEVLDKMGDKLATIRDLHVTFKVTKFDAVFEEKSFLRIEFFHRKPDLTKIDTYRKTKTGEEHTQQVIIGPDYVVRVWPKTKHAERRRVDPEEMKRQQEDRNDPLTFLSRKPDDLKKDFDVKMIAPAKPGHSTLRITPKRKDVPFDYDSVELSVDRTTWLPSAVKAIAKGDPPDWSLYEVQRFRINAGLTDADFKPLPGIKIEEVKDDKPAKETEEK